MNENETLAMGIKKEKKSFSLVWIAPIIALIITSGMIYKSYMNTGTRIHIIVNKGDGIKIGKTKIMYKGVSIGFVESIHIKEDNISKLEIVGLINKDDSKGATRKGNKYWVVRPKIGLTEVSGLDTVLSGIYIAVMPAAKTKDKLYSLPFQDTFIAEKIPPLDIFNPGFSIILNTINKGDISIGAPVLYKKQKIGNVASKSLSKNRKNVNLTLRIEGKYRDLVHQKTIFYKIDGLGINLNKTGLKINMASLASLISGGIGLYNSKESEYSTLAIEYQKYNLYDNYEDIMLSNDEVILSVKKNYSFTPGVTKIFYKSVEAGIVKDVVFDPESGVTKIKLKINKLFRKYANINAYFWIVNPRLDFNKIEGLDTIISGSYINFSSTNLKAEKKKSFILYDEKPKLKGINVKLISKDVLTLKKGASVFYHGIKIGSIDRYVLNKDNKLLTINLIIKPNYSKLINSSSSFYHISGVSIEASLSNLIVNTGSLETMLRGGIGIETSTFEGQRKLKQSYVLYENRNMMLKTKEEQKMVEEGLHIIVKARRLGNLKKNTSVFFRQVKIGSVIDYNLSKDSTVVDIEVVVEPNYSHLIRKNSYFFNTSGIGMEISLFGAKIKTESIESILTGGIGVLTPDNYNEKAKSKDTFELHDSFDEEALLWSPKLCLIEEDCEEEILKLDNYNEKVKELK